MASIVDRRFFGGGSGGSGIPVSDRGTPDGVATLDGDGKLSTAQLPADVVTSTQLAAASGVATLDSTGKVPTGQLPALAIVDYLGGSSGTANQAAMLALTGQPGDWTVRTDTSTVWMIIGADPSQLASWKELAYPSAPVTSVAGKTGVVTVSKTDVGLSNVDNTSDVGKPVSTAQGIAIAAKPNLAGPGNPPAASAPGDTAAVGTGSTAAHADHVHPREAFGPSTAQTAFGAARADGTSTSLARADHVHGTPSLTTATPQALSPTATAAPGTDSKAAHADHVHGLPAFGNAAGTIAEGNDSRITGALQQASDLSDLHSASTARTNLGLGNVDDTADTDKPVSTAVSNALALKADLVGGTIPTNQLPAIAITDVYPVANQAEMLALNAQRGDIAIRADNGKTYALATETPNAVGDWKEMPAVGAITSVNGATGVVVLGKTDVGLGNVDNTSDAAKPVSDAVAQALGLRLVAANNLSDVADTAQARTNLGAVSTSDGRLSDARTPTAHAASHAAGGGDAVTLAQSQVTGLVAALAAVGSVIATATKTAGYAATAGQLVPVDASGGAVVVTLPAANTAGQLVVVRKVDSSTNAVTVQRAGTDVIGVSDITYMLALRDQAVTFVSAGGGVWHVASDAKTLATLDTRYQRALGFFTLTDPQYYSGDASAAWAAIAAAMPSTGCVLYVPPGTYAMSAPVQLKVGMHVLGPGRQVAVLQFAAGGMYWSTNVNSITVEGLRIECGGGHMFYGSGDSSHNGLYQSQFRDLYLKTTDATSSIMYHHSIVDFGQNLFEDSDVLLATGRTVPGWDIVNSNHAANSNIWRNIRIDGQNATNVNALGIWVENTDINGYAYDNVIENITGERNPAGLVRALSWRGGRISQVVDWDTTVTYVNHHIHLGKSASGTGNTSRNVEIRGCGRRGASGGLGSTNDVFLATGEVQYIDVFAPHNNGVSGSIGFSTGDVVNVYNAGSASAWTGQPSGVYSHMHSLDVATVTQSGSRRTAGTGTPEGVLVGNPGDTFHRTDGTPQTSMYIKGSGTSSRGWISVPGPLWNVMDWGVHGDGAVGQWDDTSALNTMFAAATPGTTIFFPQPVNYYKITGPLTPPAGVTIIGAGVGCEIRQATQFKPVFDLYNVDNVTVSGFLLTNQAGAPSSTGTSFRGDSGYAYSAGVWANGNNITVRNCKIVNFAVGTYFNASNGTVNGVTPLRLHNRSIGNEVVGANFSTLYLMQENLLIEGLYAHDNVDSSSGANPVHAVYGTGAATQRSKNVTVVNCQAKNVGAGFPGSAAYQLKYVDGLVIGNLEADSCYGLLNVLDGSDLTGTNLTGINITSDTSTGALYMASVSPNPNPKRVRLSGINIQMASADTRVINVTVDDARLSDVSVASVRNGAAAANYDVILRGNRVSLDGYKSRNTGTGTGKAILVGTSTIATSDVSITNPEIDGSSLIADFDTTCTGTNAVVFAPALQRRITNGRATWFNAVGGSTITWQAIPIGAPTVIDVTAYGVVGDGTTDNSTALQALLDSAGTNQAGCELHFPPLTPAGARAVYCFGTTLNAKSRSGVKLVSVGSQANGTSAELRYTGTGSASGITWGSSKGFGIRGLAVTYSSATYSGILLDGSLDVGHGDGMYARFERCWFGPTGAGGNLATLVCLDGTHDIDFNQCAWWAGNIQLLGKKTQGVSSTGGWAIRVTLTGCSFAGSPATAAIKNADEAWDINAVFEPDSAGRACAYTHDTGLRALGVTLRSCWAGDLTSSTQPWIVWSGDGLTIQGGRWAGNATIVQVDANNCHGITLSGMAITNTPVGYAVDYGATTGCTGLVVLGTDLSIYTSPFNNPPVGYITQIGGGVLDIGGTVQATTVAATSTLSTPAAVIVPHAAAVNLMTAAQASYETASGWAQNLKGTIAQDAANALVGTHSLKLTVTDTSGAGGSGSPSFYATVSTGIVPGQVYTALGSGKGLDSAQSYRMSIVWRDASNASLGTTYGSIVAGSTTAWTQVSVTATAPATAASAILTVFVWTAGGTVGDRHVFDQFQFAAGTSLTWVDPAGVAALNLLPAAPGSPPANSGVTLYIDNGHLKAQRSDGSVSVVTSPFSGGIATPTLEVTGLTGALADGRFVGFTASGAPTAGTFAVGDTIISKVDGSVYVCTAAGTPGTWVSPTSGALPAGYTSIAGDRVTTGETVPQRDRIGGTVALSTGGVYWTNFTAEKTESITTVEMGGIGAAAAGVTLARVGVYSVDATGALTALLASSANDTTAFNAASKTQPFTLSSTWSKVAGTRYALAFIMVATTMPSVHGLTLPSNGWIAARLCLLNPMLGGRFLSQTDLPASMAAPVATGSVPVGAYQFPAFYIH
jgi:hypothetical protein